MSAQIIDGNAHARVMLEDIEAQVSDLLEAGRPLQLRAVQVGQNPASAMYVRKQAEDAEAVGIPYVLDELPDDTTPDVLEAHLRKLNSDPDVTGIILQMPLPRGFDEQRFQAMLAPGKDVECVTPAALGGVFAGTTDVAPCTAESAVELARSTGVDLSGTETVVVGRSLVVGKPALMLMMGHHSTVTCCHSRTRDLAAQTRRADVLIVATGRSQINWQRFRRARKAAEQDPGTPRPELPDLSYMIDADMVKPGAVVIDVATNRIPARLTDTGKVPRRDDGKLDMITTGDVDFESVKNVAGYITPVPGGVGPVTVAMLLRNTVNCARALMARG